MAKYIQVTIPEPCHVKRSEMKRNEQGFYCDACRKNVIDFAGKTDHEVYEIITGHEGKICGSFMPEQLRRPLQKIEFIPPQRNLKVIAAGFIGFFSVKLAAGYSGTNNSVTNTFLATDTSSYKASLQKDDPVTMVPKTWKDASTGLVTGQVVNRSYQGISQVEILFEDSVKKLYTDSNGYFSFQTTYNMLFPPKITFVKEGYLSCAGSVADIVKAGHYKLVMRPEFEDCEIISGGLSYQTVPIKTSARMWFRALGYKIKKALGIR